MKGINLGRRKIISLILCVVFLVATILMVPQNTYILKALDGNPGQNVSSLLSNIIVNMTDTDHDNASVVTNNTAVKPLYVNNRYTVKINWSISSANYDNRIEAGDYFYLDISDSYFSFSNSAAPKELIYESHVIGKWKIIDNKIYCEFTEDCENYAQASGYFEATGTLISSERDFVDVTIGGVPIVMQFNPLGEGFTHSGRPALQAGGNLFTKFATTQSTNWNLQVNFNNAIQYALGNGATTPTVHNVIVKDILQDDQIIEQVGFTTPINYPKDANTLTIDNACRVNIISQLTKIEQTGTIEEWEQYIASHPKTYGISADKKTFIANLGDLPGSMYIADSRENFKKAIYQHTPNVTAEEVEALADLYEVEGKYPVIAVAIYIKARSEFGVFQKEAYANKAWLVKDGEVPISANAIMQIEDSNAGIEVVAPLNATLTKTDYHTGTAIAGARFKLEVLNGSVWSQYVPNSGETIRTTDSSGKVTFENLPDGTYRFVEVEAAATYDPSSVIYSKAQFTITSSDLEGVNVYATNKKIEVSEEETTTPSEEESSSEETTTPSEEESSSEETTQPSSEETTTPPEEETSSEETTQPSSEETTTPPEEETSSEETTQPSSEETTTESEEPSSEETTQPSSEEQTEPSSEETTSGGGNMEEATTDDGKANENETLKPGGTEGDNTTTTNESTDDNESQKPDGGVGTGDNGKFKMWFILASLFLCIMIAGYVVGINKHKIKEN